MTQVRRLLVDCPGALGVLEPQALRNGMAAGIGGAEVRAWTFAKWLAKTGRYHVTFLLASDLPQGERIQADGLWLQFEARNPTARAPWLRLMAEARQAPRRLTRSFIKRVTGQPDRRDFVESLDWEILVAMGVTNRTASLVRSAQMRQRPCVVCVTSDRTLIDLTRQGRSDRGAYGEKGKWVRYALQNATAVVAQTQAQVVALRQCLGITAHHVPNPIDLHARTDGESAASVTARWGVPDRPYVLWVGRADTFSKRADLALDVARCCGALPFVMVMNRHDEQIFAALTRSLPPNVTLIETVAFGEIESLYQRAGVLLNTSEAEGFPNSFLQAGKYGVPVVSWKVDPDELLTRHGCGICCQGHAVAIPAAIESLMSVSGPASGHSEAIRRYVTNHHALEPSAASLDRLLESLLRRHAA